MKQYLELLQDIVNKGYAHEDRTGVGRISVIGRQIRFDLSAGFPLVTTRKIFTKALIEEMLWFIRGRTDTKELVSKGVNIWNHWALQPEHIAAFKDKYVGEGKSVPGYEEVTVEQHNEILDNAPNEMFGNIGPMYGFVWRNSLTGIDQLSLLIKNLKERPYSSRHVVTAWIPEYIPDETMSPQDNIILNRGALAPCHMMFQCFVSKPKVNEKPKLSLMMTQRSADLAVGIPYNIAQYSLLTHLLAHECGYDVGEFIWSGGDVHIYENQLELAKVQLGRLPQPLPSLWLNPEVKSIFDFTADDIKIMDYSPLEKIDYPVAI